MRVSKLVGIRPRARALGVVVAITVVGFNASAQMLGEPVAKRWMPADILNWSPGTDPDAAYNRSSVPLAPRISNPALNFNPHARINEARVMPLVAFNSTPVVSSQGSRTTNFYAVNYWQYMHSLVGWGGVIYTPPAHIVDAAHRNGVPVTGTVFLAPYVYGGNIQYVNQFLQKNGTNFPVADKMIEAARYLGLQGWFINQETENGNAAIANAMRDFILYFRAKAPELTIQWYDSMVEAGHISWQNQLNSQNDWYMKWGASPVSHEMFLNFWWGSNWGDSTRIPNSRTHALSLGLNPYDIYAGIDTEGGGYHTSGIDWNNLFPEGQPHRLSLGIYRPEWTFNASSGFADFQARDNRYWIGPNGDPSNTSSAESWKGIAHYIPANSPVTSLPFVTSFNTGVGTNFVVNGESVMSGPWNNLSLQDILPTWRWLIRSSGAKLTPTLDWSDAYHGGTVLRFNGTLSATNHVLLYQASLPVSVDTQLRVAYKAGSIGASRMELGVAFEDSPETHEFFPVPATTNTGWNLAQVSLGAHAARRIAVLSLRFGAAVSVPNYSMKIGQLAVFDGAVTTPATVSNIAIDRQYNLGWTNYALRLKWDHAIDPVYYYNIYRRNPDNSRSWLWATPNNVVYLPALTRRNNEAVTAIEVETVGRDFGVSTATFDFVWIDPETVTLTASDSAGMSSFDNGLNWSDGLQPAATNLYLVGGGLSLRTPETNSSVTFQGGALVVTNGGALRLKGTSNGSVTTIGQSPGAGLFLANGIVSDWANRPQTLSGYINLGDGGGTFEPQSSTLTVASVITGNGPLIVDGPSGITGGTVVLAGANAYSGLTVLNAANTLRLSESGTLGSGASSLVFSNNADRGFGTLDLNGRNAAVNHLIGPGGWILNNGGGNAVLTIGASNATGGLFTGVITDHTMGDGTIALNKTGSGLMTLGGASNVFGGGLNVTSGTLIISNASSVVVGHGAGSLGVASGPVAESSMIGLLDVIHTKHFAVDVDTIAVGTTTAAGGSPAINGGLKLGTNSVLRAAESIVVGDMDNAFNTLVQSVTTAPNGVTIVNTPNLTIGGSKASASFTLGAGSLLQAGTSSDRTSLRLGVSAGGGSGTYTGNFNAAAGILKAYLRRIELGFLSNGSSGNENGLLTISSNPSNHLDIAGSGILVTIGRFISGSGAGKATGTLTIGNLDATSAITSTDNSAAILLGATANSSGTLNLNGGTLTITTAGPAISGGAGTSTLLLNGITLKPGVNSSAFITNLTTATVGVNGVTFDTSGFNIVVAQALGNGGGGVRKFGMGMLTLTRPNAYVGPTFIGEGTLALANLGAIASSSVVVISNGAVLDVAGRADQMLTIGTGKTLRGSGTVVGRLTVSSGAIVRPGDAIGTLTVHSNINMSGTALLELNRTNAPNADQMVSLSGSISASGPISVANLGPELEPGDTFLLFNVPITGVPALDLPALRPGLAWTNLLGVNGTIAVVQTMATTPTNIQMRVSAAALTLSWPAEHIGWRLQVQTNALGAGLGSHWYDVFQSSATNQLILPLAIDEGWVLFRLVRP
ncbi:MAG TPA: autotransporter-associated beta strand repeat-containing protein [Verrucomicrobiae bacterium]|nr:autotransporter-associated beta strand repeat-containing protein [Verrucomicrobiae bacterium]